MMFKWPQTCVSSPPIPADFASHDAARRDHVGGDRLRRRLEHGQRRLHLSGHHASTYSTAATPRANPRDLQNMRHLPDHELVQAADERLVRHRRLLRPGGAGADHRVGAARRPARSATPTSRSTRFTSCGATWSRTPPASGTAGARSPERADARDGAPHRARPHLLLPRSTCPARSTTPGTPIPDCSDASAERARDDHVPVGRSGRHRQAHARARRPAGGVRDLSGGEQSEHRASPSSPAATRVVTAAPPGERPRPRRSPAAGRGRALIWRRAPAARGALSMRGPIVAALSSRCRSSRPTAHAYVQTLNESGRARVLAGELRLRHGLHQRLYDDDARRGREVGRRGGAGMEPGRGQLPGGRPPDHRDRRGDGGGRRARRPASPTTRTTRWCSYTERTGSRASSRRSRSRRCSRAPTAASSTPTCRSTPSGATGRTSIRASIPAASTASSPSTCRTRSRTSSATCSASATPAFRVQRSESGRSTTRDRRSPTAVTARPRRSSSR